MVSRKKHWMILKNVNYLESQNTAIKDKLAAEKESAEYLLNEVGRPLFMGSLNSTPAYNLKISTFAFQKSYKTDFQ
jgi:hypothetical protein